MKTVQETEWPTTTDQTHYMGRDTMTRGRAAQRCKTAPCWQKSRLAYVARAPLCLACGFWSLAMFTTYDVKRAEGNVCKSVWRFSHKSNTTHHAPHAVRRASRYRTPRARSPAQQGGGKTHPRTRKRTQYKRFRTHTHTPTQVAHITTPCAPQHTRHTAHLTPHAAQRAQRTHTPRARVCTHAHAHAHQRKSLSPCTPREPPNIKRARKTHHRNN